MGGYDWFLVHRFISGMTNESLILAWNFSVVSFESNLFLMIFKGIKRHSLEIRELFRFCWAKILGNFRRLAVRQFTAITPLFNIGLLILMTVRIR